MSGFDGDVDKPVRITDGKYACCQFASERDGSLTYLSEGQSRRNMCRYSDNYWSSEMNACW